MRMTVALISCLSIMLTGGLCLADENSNPHLQSLAQYYGASPVTVQAVANRGLPADELPVVFFLTQRTRLTAGQIVKLRSQGRSYQWIARLRCLSAADFYVRTPDPVESEMYAPIYARFETTPRQIWSEIELSDEEILRLVNLEYIAGQGEYSVAEAMSLCEGCDGFAALSEKVLDLKTDRLAAQGHGGEVLSAGMGGGF